MSNRLAGRRPGRCRAGFSLASIFLLTAVVAVYAAGLRMAVYVHGKWEIQSLLSVGSCGLIVGAVVGLVIGRREPRPRRGALLGAAAGSLFGPPSMLLILVPGSVPVVLVGSVILLVFALAVRWLSDQSKDA